MAWFDGSNDCVLSKILLLKQIVVKIKITFTLQKRKSIFYFILCAPMGPFSS